MRLLLLLAASALAWSQTTPDLNGVWKANKEKSKLPPQMASGDYYVSIQQTGPKIVEKTLTMGEHFEQRAEWSYDTSGAETTNTMREEKLASKAAWDSGSLVIDTKGQMEGRELAIHEKWTPAADGSSLTVVRNDGRGEVTMVLDKQSGDAANVFTAPPRMAKAVYQNVKDLDVPAYRLGDIMGNFTRALGVNCGFCHVRGNFASDDKKEKQFARTMIEMTHGVNHDVFHDHPRVSCYTCHRGQKEPVTAPPETASNAGH